MSTRFGVSNDAIAHTGGPAADANAGSNSNTSRHNPIHADAAADRNAVPATDPNAGTNAVPDPAPNAASVDHAVADAGPNTIAHAYSGTDRHAGRLADADCGAQPYADDRTLAGGVSGAHDRADRAAADATATHTPTHHAADTGRAADPRPGCAGAPGGRSVGGGALRRRRQPAGCGPANRDHGHVPRAEPAQRAAQLPWHRGV